MRMLAVRRLAQVAVGRPIVSRLFPAQSRATIQSPVFGRKRGIFFSSSQAEQVTEAAEENMSTENGTKPVSAEEVELLRKQLETLQV